MLSVDTIVSNVQSLMDSINIPAMKLPPTLTYIASINRTGGSPMKTASEIIENLGKMGFPTSKTEDGKSNMTNQFVYAIVNGIYEMIENDMIFEVATPVGGIVVSATGGNAGGPVTVVGTNQNTVISYGIGH